MLHTSRGDYVCESLVIATGGLSIPSMGASPFGYRIAEQFGIKVWPPSAAGALYPATKGQGAPGAALRHRCGRGGADRRTGLS